MEIKIWLCKENVPFTEDSIYRPSFNTLKALVNKETIDESKERFFSKYFDKPTQYTNFNMVDNLNASLNIEVKDYNKQLKTNYVCIQLDGFKRYYFVKSFIMKNSTTATLFLKLDTITTYLDLAVKGSYTMTQGHVPRTIENALLIDEFKLQPITYETHKINIIDDYKNSLPLVEQSFDFFMSNNVAITAIAKPKPEKFDLLIDNKLDGCLITPIHYDKTLTNVDAPNDAKYVLLKNSGNLFNVLATPLPFIENRFNDNKHIYFDGLGQNLDVSGTFDNEVSINHKYIDRELERYYEKQTLSSNYLDIKEFVETTKFEIVHIGGKSFPIDIRFFSGFTINMKYKQTIEPSGTTFILEPFNNPVDGFFNERYFTSGQNILRVSFNLLRNINTDIFKQFINNNLNNVNQSKNNAITEGAIGGVGGFLVAIASIFTLNPVGVVGGITAMSGSIAGSVNKVKTIDSNLRDLKNRYSDMIAGDKMTDVFTLLNKFGDSWFNLVKGKVSDYLIETVKAKLLKYGYKLPNFVVNAKSYKDIFVNTLINHIESPDFYNVLDKTVLSPEIVADISNKFMSGISLWTWDLDNLGYIENKDIPVSFGTISDYNVISNIENRIFTQWIIDDGLVDNV